MPLMDRVQKDMVEAMKGKQELRLSAIRMLKAALMKHKVDSMKELDETEELKVLNILLKQRKESVDMFRKGGRVEQAEREEGEIAILEAYLPAAVSEQEIDDAIAEAIKETGVDGAKQMGVVMKAVQAKFAGKRVDGKALSDKVRSRLS